MAKLTDHDFILAALEHTLHPARAGLTLAAQQVAELLDTPANLLPDSSRRVLTSLQQTVKLVTDRLLQTEAALVAAYAKSSSPDTGGMAETQEPEANSENPWDAFAINQIRAWRLLQQVLPRLDDGKLQEEEAATLIVDAFLPVPPYFSLTAWVVLEKAEKELVEVLKAQPLDQATLSARLRERAGLVSEKKLAGCLAELANRIDETQYCSG